MCMVVPWIRFWRMNGDVERKLVAFSEIACEPSNEAQALFIGHLRRQSQQELPRDPGISARFRSLHGIPKRGSILCPAHIGVSEA